MLAKFNGNFPATRAFSKFARELVNDVDPRGNPDHALVTWMEIEERLFVTLERHLVGDRLRAGFDTQGTPDVDGFLKFSLSVQNRRKSRAGFAFANHIEELIKLRGIRYKREATTEKRAGPDFLFPGECEYHDSNWPEDGLIMLAAKTTCKDRWRQALAEANRIKNKHLITLEPGISPTQTTEMRRERLQLIVPAPLHQSYRDEQKRELLSVLAFLELVQRTQRRAG